MFKSTETRYAATTLPKASTTSTIKTAYESKHQSSQQQQIEFQQLQNIRNEYRPTYGAYINNLPRGPYLQYKFNDQQSAYSKRNDNNQKNRQIELLKHEFMVLPRAKISSINDPLSTQTNNNNNCLNGVQTAQGLSTLDYNESENPNLNGNDNCYSAINETTTKTTTFNIIESINYNKLSNANHNNFVVEQDFVCDYNNEAATKHDSNKTTNFRKKKNFRQIRPENFDMTTNLNNFSTKIEPICLSDKSEKRQDQVKIANKIKFPINYVTLLDIMYLNKNGFTQDQGWAILCQSIQSLQDLFLADTPSTTRLLPLVNLSNFQVTFRGRVVFNVIPAGQLDFNNDVTSFPDISFLSPEYVNSVGKKISFSESDIEKMWIYSLGVTLHKAVASRVTPTNRTISGSLTKINADRENDDVMKTPVPSLFAITTNTKMYQNYFTNRFNENGKMLPSLDNVLSSMCAPKLSDRASLMYLLDIISDYSRCHHQMKPFSHIVMELFQDAINEIEKKRNSLQLSTFNKEAASLENRSDTDSGQSSIQGGRYIYINNDAESNPRSLPVHRCNKNNNNKQFNSDIPFNKFNTIGYSARMEMEEKPLELAKKRLQVTRRRDEIIKRRNRSRRNTIAVNMLDIENGYRRQPNKLNWDCNSSKSTNCIDKIENMEEKYFVKKKTEEIQLANFSALESKDIKFATLPNLKVRKPKTTTYSNDSSIHLAIKSKGPEFISNSSLSPSTIDITDAKCQHTKRVVSVLLLNGKSFQITCNSATTTAIEIFETIIKHENYVENFFLGICALIGGDFVVLPPDLKIHKVAPEIWSNTSKKGCFTENVIFTLFLRIKFYLPTLRGVSSLASRHLLYLQLRKSILESHILCNDEELISLGGLALQSEIGDFTDSMKQMDYFTISHYLPEGVFQRNKAMGEYLRNSHYSKKGLHSRDAEYNFVRYVQEMKEYGFHLFSAIWITETDVPYDVYVGLSLSGIRVFRRLSTSHQDQPMENSKSSKAEYQRKLYANFEWLEIENLCFSKHTLCVVIRKSESLKAKDNNRVKFKFRMDGRKSCFAFHLASEHHRFYMKLRNSFISIKALSDELNIPLDSISLSADEKQTDEMTSDENVQLNGVNFDQPNSLGSSNKTAKSTDSRGGKLKKSMLNDNRLLKLRNKFLKRSKSSVELRERICSNPNGRSKEENQNKENENPKIEIQSQSVLLSPKRNRVKMGTRVFFSNFLNKSFDDVSDISGSNFSRFDFKTDLANADAETSGYENNFSDDCMSLKSTSSSSLYYSRKVCTTPLSTDAYVIQSSIKSSCDINHFPMFNETVSDSLLDKFNNLSKNNTIGDRVISTITIVKENIVLKMKSAIDSGGNCLTDDNSADKFSLGISIVQGSDNNVYVKDLVQNGPGEKNGVQIGDQIIAVNGKPLLNLPYDESLKILQNTGLTVELIVSQIFKKSMTGTSTEMTNNRHAKFNTTIKNIKRSMKNSFKLKKNPADIENVKNKNGNSKSNAVNWKCNEVNDRFTLRSTTDLPKVVGIIPKHQTNDKETLPRSLGLSRKYVGPVRYPVTPVRPVVDK